MRTTQASNQLPIFILKEENAFIAFSPALDLSTSGKTPNEAKVRFSEAMTLFFEELIEQGSLKEVDNILLIIINKIFFILII